MVPHDAPRGMSSRSLGLRPSGSGVRRGGPGVSGVRRGAGAVLGVAVCAVAFTPAGPARADDPVPSADRSGSTSALVAAAEQSAESGSYGKAVELAFQAIEASGSEPWDRQTRRQFLESLGGSKMRGWFNKLSKDERKTLLDELETEGEEIPVRSEAPLAKSMTKWVRQIRPGKRFQSPEAKVALGLAHWEMGNRIKALAYAMDALKSDPESLAAEYAGAALVGTHLLRGNIKQARANAQLVVGLVPESPASAFGIVYLDWWYCYTKQIDEARRLNDWVMATAKPGTWAARAARTMSSLIADIEQGRYATAVDKVCSLREVHGVGWLDPILLTFMMRVDLRRRGEPDVQQEIERLIEVFDQILDHEDPYHSQFARLVLARVYHIERQTDRAIALLTPLTAKGNKRGFNPRAYALWNLGRILADRDPDKAIPVLEEFYEDFKNSTGADRTIRILGDLYLKRNQNDKALALFQWLDARLKSGRWMMTANQEGVTVGLGESLLRVGREAEARQVGQSLIDEMSQGEDKEVARRLVGFAIGGCPRHAALLRRELIARGLSLEAPAESYARSAAQQRSSARPASRSRERKGPMRLGETPR